MVTNRIEIGDKEITGVQNITSGSQNLSKSLLNDVLEIDTLDCDFNSNDPSVLSSDGQKVVYYHGEDQRQILYVDNIERTGKSSYHLYAVSAISRLDSIPHSGGIYTGETVKEVVEDICGTIPVIVKTNLQDIKLYGWLPYCNPPNNSARDNLNQVLFAIGASLGTDLNGTLRVEPLWDGISSVIQPHVTELNGSINYSQKVSAISVTEHQYISGEEEADLFDGTAQNGDIIIFGEPMHSLSATGFSIQESGANYAIVSDGTGKLTGKKYIHITRKIKKNVYPDATENEKSKENATLVSLVNSESVSNRMVNYYKCSQTIRAAFIVGKEAPGQIVSIMDPYDAKMVSACIASMNVNMSQVLKADAELLVDYIPPQPGSTQYYDTSEVITQSGTWTVPEGVTSVRVILIGGGSGGTSGESGGDGIAPTLITVTSGSLVGRRYPYGLPGAGGQGGPGGDGGKVYESPLSVTPGQVINVTIGAGGKGGGPGNLVPGGVGGDTTFGELSSASGEVSETGYKDIFSGHIYAKKSTVNGTSGGRGTGANEDSSDSYVVEGETVNGYVPGTEGETDEYDYDSKTRSIGYGGLGGGPAMGANGKNGGNGSASYSVPSSGYSILEATGGRGGNGATPTIIPGAATNPGDGGAGGHGGGGAGGSGDAVAVKPGTGYGGFFTSVHLPEMANGGTGGKGGDGAPGCVILYYQVPEPVQSGQVVDKNNKMLLDRLGRRVIV